MWVPWVEDEGLSGRGEGLEIEGYDSAQRAFLVATAEHLHVSCKDVSRDGLNLTHQLLSVLKRGLHLQKVPKATEHGRAGTNLSPLLLPQRVTICPK